MKAMRGGGNVKGLLHMCCLNGKVIVGLAVVGLGVWVAVPTLVGAAVPLLLTAICPLSMLAMVVGMGRGRGMGHLTPAQAPGVATPDLPTLQARRAALVRDIAHLEGRASPVVREAVAVAEMAEMHGATSPRVAGA